ncbi:hypothetical protein [Saccharothrix syringae]|uniref:Uncharacterized protein n=1 Tax=Saccharothrix syringae TaxID=103733 RepID=A0A5Q0H417_SACSY|nr:hypothetical protein [Saccharothrix syringae]QFZ20655.1 hypothetical protein EKG83_27530 [Saccharothrix syringae]
MAPCGPGREHRTSGARAFWELSCSGEKVKVHFHQSGNWKYSEPVGPKGDREYFSWTEPGAGANVYLYEYDA